MRSVVAVLVAILALSAAPQAAGHVGGSKQCSRSFVRATIDGDVKCLRTGQFCARRYDRQYRRYGFRCLRKSADDNGRYHLTEARRKHHRHRRSGHR